jgi:hypothetical protein
MGEWTCSCKHLQNEIQSFHFGSHPAVPVFINHTNANKYFENVADFRYFGVTELTHSTNMPGAAIAATNILYSTLGQLVKQTTTECSLT